MSYMKNINIKLVLKSLVSFLFLLFFMKMIDFNVFKSLSVHLLLYLFFAVILVLCFLGFMAYRWKILIKFTIKDSQYLLFSDLYKFYLISSFFNIFLPGSIGGDVTRIKNSNEKYSLGIKKASLLVFIERVSGVVSLTILFAVGILFYTNNELLVMNINHSTSFILIFSILLLVVLLKKLLERKMNISYLFLLKLLFYSMIAQFCDIVIVFLFSNYFNLPLTVPQLMIVIPLVYAATILPISLGGIGVRESVMVTLLTFFGIEASISFIISLMMSLSKIGAGLIGWLVYLRSR